MEKIADFLESEIMYIMPLLGLLSLIIGVVRYRLGGEGKSLGLLHIFLGLVNMILPFFSSFDPSGIGGKS